MVVWVQMGVQVGWSNATGLDAMVVRLRQGNWDHIFSGIETYVYGTIRCTYALNAPFAYSYQHLRAGFCRNLVVRN